MSVEASPIAVSFNGGKDADITRLHSEMLVMQADYELQLSVLRGELARQMRLNAVREAVAAFQPGTARSVINEFQAKDLRIAELEKQLKEALEKR